VSTQGTLSAPQPSALERWQRLALRWKLVLAIVVAGLLIEFVGSTVSGIYNPSPASISGTGSSFDSTDSGSAALAQLLRQQGHPVTNLTTPLSQADTSLPSGSTVFLVDPQGNATPDASAIGRLLARDDEVVLAGQPSAGALHTLFQGRQPTWSPEPSGTAHPAQTSAQAQAGTAGSRTPEVVGVQSVTDAGFEGSWSSPGSAQPLLVGSGGALALLATSGPGRLVLLASPSPFYNGLLGDADNAAFALNLAGGAHSTRPVVFDEYDHGFGRQQAGLSGLPGHWKAGLLIALLAVALAMVGAARRFGPPAPADRELIPPRAEHLDAMATLLASGSPDRLAEAADPVRLAARRELQQRLKLGHDATEAEWSAALAAAAAGDRSLLPEGVAAAVLGSTDGAYSVTADGTTPPASTTAHRDDIVRLGRALATLNREGRPR
jgi:hypothetical protein